MNAMIKNVLGTSLGYKVISLVMLLTFLLGSTKESFALGFFISGAMMCAIEIYKDYFKNTEEK